MVGHLFKGRCVHNLKTLFYVPFQDVAYQSVYIVPVVAYELKFRKTSLTHIVVKPGSPCCDGFGGSRLHSIRQKRTDTGVWYGAAR